MKAVNRNWWILLVQGIFFLGVGAAGFFSNDIGLAEVTQYLGLVFAVFGFLIMTFAFGFRKKIPQWIFMLVAGILQLAFGVLILAYPTTSTQIFTSMIGGFALAIGLFQLVYGLLRKGRMLFIINAVVSLIFGVLIVLNPFEERETLTFLVCLYSMILGLSMGYYSFRVRNWSHAALKRKEKMEMNQSASANQDAPSD